MTRSEGWQNPLVEWRNVPFFVRIYEQIMLRDMSGAEGNTNPKTKHPVYAHGPNKKSLIFEDKDEAAKHFNVSVNTIYNWTRNGTPHDGYYFKMVDPTKEEDVCDSESTSME